MMNTVCDISDPKMMSKPNCYHSVIRDIKKMPLTRLYTWIELLAGKQPLYETDDAAWFRKTFGYAFTEITSMKKEKEAMKLRANLKSWIMEKLATHTVALMENPPVLKVLQYAYLHSPVLTEAHYIVCWPCTRNGVKLPSPWNVLSANGKKEQSNKNLKTIEEEKKISLKDYEHAELASISMEEWCERFFYQDSVNEVS